MLNDEPVDILVVDDNHYTRQSIVESLKACMDDVRVVAVDNGDEALDFLLARGAWEERAGEDPPKLILLDLQMPGSDGFSVLGQIRTLEPEHALTITPVVVFSDSNTPGDIAKSYRCGANSYVIKPISFPDFQAIINCVAKYWMSCNKTNAP